MKINLKSLFTICILLLTTIISCRKEVINYTKFGKNRNFAKLIEYDRVSDSVIRFKIKKSVFLKQAELKFISKDSGVIKYSEPVTNIKSDSLWLTDFNIYSLRNYFSNTTDQVLVEFFGVDSDNKIWRDSTTIQYPKAFSKLSYISYLNDSISRLEFRKNVYLKSSEVQLFDSSTGKFATSIKINNAGNDTSFSVNLNRYQLRDYFSYGSKTIEVLFNSEDIHGNKFSNTVKMNNSLPEIKISKTLEMYDSMIDIEIFKNITLKSCVLNFKAKDSFNIKYSLNVDVSNNDLFVSNKINHFKLSEKFPETVKYLDIELIAVDKNGKEYYDNRLIPTKFKFKQITLFSSFGNLLGLWTLANDFSDLSINKNNGTGNGNIQFQSIPGTNLKAAYFDGNSNVNIPHSNSVNPTVYSISAYIYPTNISDNWHGIIISKWQQSGWGAGFEFSLNYNSSSVYNVYSPWQDNSSKQTHLSPSAYGFNVPHHVCVTHSASYNRIYVDGVLVSEKSSNGTISNSNTLDISIGRRWTGGWHPFTGYIKDVAVWGKELNSSEVAQIYNNLYK